MNDDTTTTPLAARIDHTILKAEATEDQVDTVTDEAVAHGFASVCVNPRHAGRVRERLDAAGSAAKACVVVAFPLGANAATLKGIEAVACLKAGAQEIDFVAHLPSLLAEDAEAVLADFLSVTVPARERDGGCVVKAILETAALAAGVSDDRAEARIAVGCRAAAEAGVDFVKTSTGFHPAGGATEQHVRWLRAHAPRLGVKASGGIRTRDDAERMLAAGATRLGCSASVAIVGGNAAAAGGY
ncbi:deoxyribose-phosphate aldolase [Phycisphaera mikurensis]|uniref:Deoxyribose-phosphate aldolase n=1 Tax=Phycisphaera mikurensis (strain NBRC 102666 / KCTC 22515 / FYK2301M01) TaxID=1142394 RepID=I0IHX0_PHYMF|nr:deoxyribose-phosphate aldolase [Phycisphaera mikurensis]MBB6441099.1 deoxyribose-phosphate aldolase [Phycisphaera mikurensis]BAM04858.1 deoxyribose-phosphate aldolase [Phycisphaera mikurensis NBRC 102666]